MNTNLDSNEKEIRLSCFILSNLTIKKYINLSRDSSRNLCEYKVIANINMQECCLSSSLPYHLAYLILSGHKFLPSSDFSSAVF